MRLTILSPIFPPAKGGAATYYSLLSRSLLESGIVDQITIITEHYPGEPRAASDIGGRLRIQRVFPYRAGSTKGHALQYLLYAIQNFQYLLLPKTANRANTDILLIHSSFLNQFNFLNPILRKLRTNFPLIADVRDRLMPRDKLEQLDVFDAIIACSDNVFDHLAKRPTLHDRIVRIPVPQAPAELPSETDTLRRLAELGMEPCQYILYGGLIKKTKGIDLLLAAYATYRNTAPKPLDLALAGVVREPTLARRAVQLPGVRLLGSLSTRDMLIAIKYAQLNVNLSRSEGMPRICLEALMLGTRVLLPSGIPEFERYCEPWVVSTDDPAKVAEKMLFALSLPPPLGRYPIRDHSIESILPRYATLLDQAVRTRERPLPASGRL